MENVSVLCRMWMTFRFAGQILDGRRSHGMMTIFVESVEQISNGLSPGLPSLKVMTYDTIRYNANGNDVMPAATMNGYGVERKGEEDGESVGNIKQRPSGAPFPFGLR